MGQAAVKGGLFLSTVVVARMLGPSAMGRLTVAYAFALILVQFLTAGQVEVLIREVARTRDAAYTLYRRAVSWQVKVALPVVIVAAVGVLLFGPGDLLLAILSFIPYAVIRARLITGGAVFKGSDRMEVEALARALEQGTALVLTLVVGLAHGPVWLVGLGFSVGAFAGAVWIRRRVDDLRGTVATPEVDRGLQWTEGLSFVGLSAVYQLLVRGDTLVLALLGVGSALLGQYGAAVTPILALITAPQILAIALYPTFSRLAQAGTRCWIVGGVALCAVASGGALLSAMLNLAAEPLMHLVYGEAYGPAVPVFVRAAWLLPGAAGYMVVGVVLSAWRRQRRTLVVLTLVTVGAIWGNCWVVPRYGLLGAATVAVMAHSVAAVLSFVMTWDWRGKRSSFVSFGPASGEDGQNRASQDVQVEDQ